MNKIQIFFFIFLVNYYLIFYYLKSKIKNIILLFVFIFFVFNSLSQVSITTSNYSQNFGTSTISSWTNNSTFLGWYLSAGGTFSFQGTVNITAVAPSNNGGFYIYECNNNDNMKLGSRPSNTSGGTAGTGQSHIGLRIRNNTGSTINSITVIYTGLQLSLAENYDGTTFINKLTFSYQTNTTVTSLTSGTWTNVTALDYTAPNNSNTFDGTASSQIVGYPCTVSQTLNQCIPVTISNGNEIMLRWSDINNDLNDPHLAIDDVQVLFHFNNDCTVTLPIELIDFVGINKNTYNHLEWYSASERDNSYYTIEKSFDGLIWSETAQIKGYGTTNVTQNYEYDDYNIEDSLYYYKLSQTDYNGIKTNLKIISIDNRKVTDNILKVTDILGRETDINNKNVLKIIYYKNKIEKRY